jgi:hypothetical protein
LGAAIGVVVGMGLNVVKCVGNACFAALGNKDGNNPECDKACGDLVDIVVAAAAGSVTAVLITMLMECAMGESIGF